MKNIYMVDLTHDYYIDIAEELTRLGYSIKVVGAGRGAEYWPGRLEDFVRTARPKVTYWDDFNLPEDFESVLDPDYSVLSPELLAQLAYYEQLFYLSTDRLAFFPIAHIERFRLFYRFVGHFHKLLTQEGIDSVVFFGTPHGPWSIALFGLAKAMNLKTLYVDWVALSPDLSTIETELAIRRSYSPGETQLGLAANGEDYENIRAVVARTVNAKFVWTATKPISLPKLYLRSIASLVLRKPFSKYVGPEFFLNPGRRTRISYVIPLVSYMFGVGRALRYYERHTTDEMPDQNSIVLFLAHQPEAATMPLGGVFADQLLVLELILAALPAGMKVFVKEHPFMFGHTCDVGQDRHERSDGFYRQMLKDPRVRFVKRSVPSQALVEKAGHVASIGGSISWEAMRAGKPCIVFGWAWFSDCASCFSVDSVDTLRHALQAAASKSRDAVLKDVRDFLSRIEKRMILAPSCRSALHYLGEDYSYDKGVRNLSSAIDLSITGSGAPRVEKCKVG